MICADSITRPPVVARAELAVVLVVFGAWLALVIAELVVR